MRRHSFFCNFTCGRRSSAFMLFAPPSPCPYIHRLLGVWLQNVCDLHPLSCCRSHTLIWNHQAHCLLYLKPQVKGYPRGCSHPRSMQSLLLPGTSDSYSLGHSCSVHLHLQLLILFFRPLKPEFMPFSGAAFQSPLNWLGYLPYAPTALFMIPFRTYITIYLILCLIGHSAH